MKKSTAIILIAIFVLSFSLRLMIAFDAPYFDNTAYYTIRQIENIETKGIPLYDDEMAYGERYAFFPPLFHYTLAGLDKFLPLNFSLKFLPNLFASTVSIIAYFLAFELTKREDSSLFASFVTSLVPVFILQTTNSLSPYSLAMPLFLLSLYFFMKTVKDSANAKYFVVTSILLIFTSTIALLLILILAVYLIIIKIEKLRIHKSEIELTIFSSFLMLWIYFLFYKKAILLHGTMLLFQNLPPAVKDQIYSQFNSVEALVLIGIIPLIAGVYITYKHIFVEKHKQFYLLISTVLVSSFVLWLKLIPFKEGLVVLALSLSVLIAEYHSKLLNYLQRSRVSKFAHLFSAILILLIIITSAGPAYYETAIQNRNVVTSEDISALLWLRTHTSNSSVIATAIPESGLVIYATGRPVVADAQFIGVSNAFETTADLRSLYRTPWQTDALRITDKYNIDYILVSDTTRKFYNIRDITYSGSRCFKTVYNGYEKVKIYRVSCSLRDE